VVSGSPALLVTTAEDWVNQVATRVKLGVTQRDAIAEVAKELRVPKRDVYDAVLASKE
jgi:16S rRNA C1402 (ribose-2'-O) methylase RsmI